MYNNVSEISIGDVFEFGSIMFLVANIDSNKNVIETYSIDDYTVDSDSFEFCSYKDINGNPIHYYPEGLFLSRECFWEKINLVEKDNLLYNNFYLVPFQMFKFKLSTLVEENHDVEWMGTITKTHLAKLVSMIPVVLERDANIIGDYERKLTEGGCGSVNYIKDSLEEFLVK